jgi:hypothetical protein
MTRNIKRKTLLKAGIVILISLALLIPVSAQIQKNEIKTRQLVDITTPIQMGSMTMPTKEVKPNFVQKPVMLGTDMPIFNSPEYWVENPEISISSNINNMVSMFEYQETTVDSNIGITYSTDGGENWYEGFIYFDWEDSYGEFPEIDSVGIINGESVFRGASMDEIGSIYLYYIDGLTDIDNQITGSSVDWSDNGFYDIQGCDIAVDDSLLGPDGTEDYYCIGYVSSFSGLAGYDDQVQIPHYMIDTGAGGVSCYWFYYTDSKNVKLDIDKASEMIYYVFEWNNEGNKDLIILSSELEYVGEVEPAGWGDGLGEGRKRMVEGSANTINPAICAEDDNIVLVFESDENGNQDLICYYSTDGGDTYQESVIANSANNELYPEVYTDGTTAICTFTMNNNLYSAISKDGGATWEIGDAINDESGSVVSEFNNADVFGDIAIWTDDRDGYNAIYMDSATSIPKPNIVIESISGGIGVTAVIRNIGTADAVDFDWSITLDGTVFLGAETSGTATLAVDDSMEIKSGFPLGFGAIDITVVADKATETATGTLLLFFITGL